MKKILCFTLCAFLLLLCIGCSDGSTPNAPDAPIAPAVVWQLTKQTTIQTNGNTTVTAFSYNEQGQMVSYEIRANGALNSQVEVGYDEGGYKNYEKSTSSSGFVTEIFFTNDAGGKILEQRTVISLGDSTVMESVAAFEYTDDYGSFVQTFTSGASKGETITVTKDAHGNETAHVTSNGASIQYENKYDGDVLVEQISKQSTPSGLVVARMSYQYDENGNNTKTTTYDDLNIVILTQIYEYSAPAA